MAKNDGLYVGQGANNVVFSSKNPTEPARFYLLSGPAYQAYPTQKITMNEVESDRIGTPEQCNVRVLNKYIHPDGVQSANLVMGLTVVEPAIYGTACRPVIRMPVEWKFTFITI